MGGFTTIQLRDRSQENIDKHNARLREHKVRKEFKFYSERDTEEEYEYFKKEDGVYPEHLFPRDKIHSLEDFKRYWNPRAVGLTFVPEVGMLTFDCYFNRTSKRAMHAIGKYLLENYDAIESVGGSFTTFLERGLGRNNRKMLIELLKDNRVSF